MIPQPRLISLASVALAATLFTACSTDPAPISAPSSAEAEPAAAPAEPAESAEAVVETGPTDLGDVLVDGDGLSLYGFTPDADVGPTCVDACADAWPPVLVSSRELPTGSMPRCSPWSNGRTAPSNCRPARGRCTASPVMLRPATPTARVRAATGSWPRPTARWSATP